MMELQEIQGEIDASQHVLALDDMLMRDDNPRLNDHAAQALAKTILEIGWGAPVLVQHGTGLVIGGHTRIKAAAILGLERVPVRVIDVDDRRARAMSLADNRIGELADWNWAMLASDLESFSLTEVEALGFDSKYLEDLASKVDGFGPLNMPPEDPMQEPIVPGGVLIEIRCMSHEAVAAVRGALSEVGERSDVELNVSS